MLTAHRSPWALATLALCGAAVTVGILFGSRVAGGADSYGYVSQAYRWTAGHVPIEQPWAADAPWPSADWTFAPVGWRPAGHRTNGEIVPQYAPGLPLLMAVSILVAGPMGPFAIGLIAACVVLWTTYRLGSHLVSPLAGGLAAWLLASSPVFLYALLLPMADLPATAAWMGAVFFIRPGPHQRPVLAGVVAALAILIRPNLVFLAIPLVALALTGPNRWRAALRLGVGLLPGPLVVSVINTQWYGHPLLSGYGDGSSLYSLERVWPNLLAYSGWILDTQPIAVGLGLLAGCVAIRTRWSRADSRADIISLPMFPLIVIAGYLPYLTFDSWTYLRFLLPAWPVMLLAAAGGAAVIAARSTVARRLVISGVALLCLWQAHTAYSLHVFDLWKQELRYQSLGHSLAGVLPADAVVLTTQHSGSLRFYAGRLTIRQDVIDPGALDTVITWLQDQGLPAYLLLEDWEVPIFQTTFAGQRNAALDGWHPIFVYEGAVTVRLYDLFRPLEQTSPFILRETFERRPPAAPRAVPALQSVPR